MTPRPSDSTFTIWLTGLPAAGKTTIARALNERLEESGTGCRIVDGDEVRREALSDLGYSKKDRDTNIKVIGYIAKTLNQVGVNAIVAVISPYAATRDAVRKTIPEFVEVHVDCDISVCIERDPKGLYKKALSGEIKGMTGLDDPYEPPAAPELRIASDQMTVDESVTAILEYLRKRNLLPKA